MGHYSRSGQRPATRRDNSVNPLSGHAKCPARVGSAQVRQHGLAGNRGLPLGDQRARAFGQIDIHPRAEADHADTRAGGDRLALARERHDAPRHETRDLDHRDALAGNRGDDEGVAFIVLARLVEIGA